MISEESIRNELIETCFGHYIVLAGPGCGKTHTITEKIVHIFGKQKIEEPYGLLALTFTDTARREMKRRLREKGFVHWHRIWIGTFHSFTSYLLRCYGSDIGIREDFEIIEDIHRKEIIKYLNTKYNVVPSPELLQLIFERMKRMGIYPGIGDESYPSSTRKAYLKYNEFLKDRNLLDFEDLIALGVKLLEKSAMVNRIFTNFFRYIIIDEFQDTDKQQLELVKIFVKDAQGSIIVGDEDQSIYKWRGACKENLFEIKNFLQANQINLTLNFRSDEVIVLAAQEVIGIDPNRIAKEMEPISSTRGKLYSYSFNDWKEEADFIINRIKEYLINNIVDNPAEIAIVVRSSYRLEKMLFHLQDEEIQFFNRALYRYQDSWEVALALGVIELFHNPTSSDNLHSVLMAIDDSGLGYHFKKGDALNVSLQIRDDLIEFKNDTIAKDDVERILKIANVSKIIEDASGSNGEFQHRLKNMQKMLKLLIQMNTNLKLNILEIIRRLKGKDAVQLISGHRSKGTEFKIVFFIGLEDGVLPDYRNLDNEDDLAEERRIFYVGLTRAKSIAYLTWAKYTNYWKPNRQSRFIDYIPETYFSNR